MTSPYRIRELKVELNRHCPLKCLHCSSNGMPHAPEKLDTARIIDLIQEFAHLGGDKVALSGGEPICYPKLPKVLEACQVSGVKTELYTSGIYSNGDRELHSMSEELLALVYESDVKTIFSLHGAKRKTHEMITQVEGSLNVTITSIERALVAGLIVEVHIVPTAVNFREIVDMVALLSSLGVRRVSWLRFVPQGRGKSYRQVLQLERGQLMRLASIKAQLAASYPKVEIRTGAPFNILCTQGAVPCVAGLSELTVCPDGHVSPCDAFKQFRFPDPFDNIMNYSLSTVWEKSHLLNTIRHLREIRSNSECASCPQYNLCNSGCLAQKTIAAGIIKDGRDPDCTLNDVVVARDEIEAVNVC